MANSDDETKDQVDPLIGRKLGRCTLERQLGQGGMGTVYLAHHGALAIKVAVKILPEVMAARRDWVQRFVREARIAAQLDHANAVRVLDVATQDGIYFLVMELVRGASLGDRLKREGAIPWREAVEQTAQAARALVRAHELGLMHRDIKPDNLMQTEDGTIKVADFGLARQVDRSDLTRAGQISGSPAFMAPEQGDGDIDERCDIYSLGVTMHALVSGAPFYLRDSLMETMAANLTQPLPSLGPHGAPAQLDRLIASMTTKDREQRIATMAEVVQRLEALTGADARPRRAAGDRRAGSAGSGPSPALLVAAAALVVLLLAGIAWSLGGAGSDGGTPVADRRDEPATRPAVEAPGSGSAASESSGSGSGSESAAAPTRPSFTEFRREALGPLSTDAALALLDQYLKGLPPGLDRSAAEAYRGVLQAKRLDAWLAPRAQRLHALVAGGRGAEALKQAAGLASAAPPCDAAVVSSRCGALVAALRASATERIEGAIAAAEARIASGDLAGARQAIDAVDDLGLQRPAARKAAALRRLAAAEQAARAAAAETARAAREAERRKVWAAALARAHAPLRAGQLEDAISALRALEADERWKDLASGELLPPELRELRAVRAVDEAVRAGARALVNRVVAVRLGRAVRKVRILGLGAGGLQVEMVGGPKVTTRIPLARIGWETRVAWAEPKLGPHGPLELAIAMRYAKQKALLATWRSRAEALDDPAVAKYLALGRLGKAEVAVEKRPDERPTPPTTIKPLRRRPGKPTEIKFRGQMVSSSVYADAIGRPWKVKLDSAIVGVSEDNRSLIFLGLAEGKFVALHKQGGAVKQSAATRGRPLDVLTGSGLGLLGADRQRPAIDVFDRKAERWSRLIALQGRRGPTRLAVSRNSRAMIAVIKGSAQVLVRGKDDAWSLAGPLGGPSLGAVTAIAWRSRTSPEVAIAYERGSLIVWNYDKAKIVRRFELGKLPAYSLVWTAGQLIAGSRGGVVRAWIEDEPVFALPAQAKVRAPSVIASSYNGSLLYVSVGKDVQVWDPRAWIKLRTLTGLPMPPSHLRWAPYTLVAACADGTVFGWSAYRR